MNYPYVYHVYQVLVSVVHYCRDFEVAVAIHFRPISRWNASLNRQNMTTACFPRYFLVLCVHQSQSIPKASMCSQAQKFEWCSFSSEWPKVTKICLVIRPKFYILAESPNFRCSQAQQFEWCSFSSEWPNVPKICLVIRPKFRRCTWDMELTISSRTFIIDCRESGISQKTSVVLSKDVIFLTVQKICIAFVPINYNQT